MCWELWFFAHVRANLCLLISFELLSRVTQRFQLIPGNLRKNDYLFQYLMKNKNQEFSMGQGHPQVFETRRDKSLFKTWSKPRYSNVTKVVQQNFSSDDSKSKMHITTRRTRTRSSLRSGVLLQVISQYNMCIIGSQFGLYL